jgi:hypothetical protein
VLEHSSHGTVSNLRCVLQRNAGAARCSKGAAEIRAPGR